MKLLGSLNSDLYKIILTDTFSGVGMYFFVLESFYVPLYTLSKIQEINGWKEVLAFTVVKSVKSSFPHLCFMLHFLPLDRPFSADSTQFRVLYVIVTFAFCRLFFFTYVKQT